MDHLGSPVNTSQESGFTPTTVNIILILFSLSMVILLRTLNAILEPMNYELDMTTKEHCKRLAEIDNNLRFRRGTKGELHQFQENQSEEFANVDSGLDSPIENDLHSLNCKNNSDNNNDRANHGQTVMHTGSANLIYPNGWIPIMESLKLRPNSVKKAIVFGRDVIITRSADGRQVNVLDAYCPHMGVHIGVGGRVRQVDNESCVECPFHGWTFRASDGLCVKIPYRKSQTKCAIPRQAKLGTWPCVEVDNFIYVWHHIDGEPPTWNIETSRQLIPSDWQLAGRSCHRTNLELRDMHENGADMNHFEGIHNDLFIFGGQLIKVRPLNYLQKYVRHHWLPEWKPVLDEAGKMTHMAETKLQSWISLFGLRLFDITVRATQVGPARVNLYYDSKWYGNGILIMNAIPMGGRQTKYVQHIYTERSLFQCFMAKWVLFGEIRMLERDFFIWNHKKNIRNPVFVPEDKILKQFRSWYSQFYRRRRKIVIKE